MTYFTKKLYTYHGYSEFIFNRKDGASCYHVSVRNGDGRAVLFTMEAAEDDWRISNAPQVPDWIRQSEKVLADEILRNLN
ncbi:MAG TPA: hypothetical protein VGE66_20455 [Chitinophagaceae bacterium]